MTPEQLAWLRQETRVSFSMEDWDELQFLADDSVEEPVTLADRFYLAWQRLHDGAAITEDVSCEDEEEDTEYAWYCRGLTLDELRAVVRAALPQGWSADISPVPEDSFAGSQITITRVPG